jgi:hypothetical protein
MTASPYYDHFKGKTFRWEELLDSYGHDRSGAYSYIANALAQHPLMDADALRPFPEELMNFESHLIDYVTKPFALHKPEGPKPFSTDVECVGINSGRAYILVQSEVAVWPSTDVPEPRVPVQGATYVSLFKDVWLSCANGEFHRSDQEEAVADIPGPTKVVVDPLFPGQFFVRSQDGEEPSELSVARIGDGGIEKNQVQIGVDDFDVSKKFLLFVTKGKAAVFAREDSRIGPLYEKNLAARARVFVDDEFFYEFLPKSQTLYVFADGEPVQQVKQVANVFKSGEIVIEYIDGTIGTVGRPPIPFEEPPIAVVSDGQQLIAWIQRENDPIVHELSEVDLPLIRRCDNLGEKLKRKLDAQQAELFTKADELKKKFERKMQDIETRATGLIDRVSDTLFLRCLRRYKKGEVDEAFSDASEETVDFKLLAGGGRLEASLAGEKLSNDTLVQAVGPLAELLQEDPSLYAQLACDVLLQIQDHPPKENIERIQTTARNLLSTETVPLAIVQTLKLIQRVAESLQLSI